MSVNYQFVCFIKLKKSSVLCM